MLSPFDRYHAWQCSKIFSKRLQEYHLVLVSSEVQVVWQLDRFLHPKLVAPIGLVTVQWGLGLGETLTTPGYDWQDDFVVPWKAECNGSIPRTRPTSFQGDFLPPIPTPQGTHGYPPRYKFLVNFFFFPKNIYDNNQFTYINLHETIIHKKIIIS